MTSVELTRKIKHIENEIRGTQSRIKKLERDYDELMALKRKTDDMERRHEETCERNKKVVSAPVFETNRCLQKLRSRLCDMTSESRSTEYTRGMCTIAEALSKKMRIVLDRISDGEAELDELIKRLDRYNAELSACLAAETCGGGEENA